MRYATFLISALALRVTHCLTLDRRDGPIPAKGTDGGLGGLFGISSISSAPSNPLDILKVGPKGTSTHVTDTTGGSGKYRAKYFTDMSLPGHTIYAPITAPPASVKLPVIAWGNGGCFASGTFFENFLTEVASHGYIIIASGAPSPMSKSGLPPMVAALGSGFTKASDLTKAIDWAVAGASNRKYGTPDTEHIAVMGQSCGGLEAYSASYHDPRVKLTVLFDSGLLDVSKTYLLKEFKSPIVYILGGPLDIAYENGERDYKNLPADLPSLKANLDTGHMGTFSALQGGQDGKIAVALLDWLLKGQSSAKNMFFDKSSQLFKDGWDIVAKNWEGWQFV